VDHEHVRVIGRPGRARFLLETAQLNQRSGSPEDTDLERFLSVVRESSTLRDLFVIESGGPVAITNSLCVNCV